MARCGCAQTCACAFQVTDGATVDFTLAGNGAPGTPYALTAEVILVPDNTGPLLGLGANPIIADALGLWLDPSGLGGGGGTAASTTFVPYGNIAAVNVQDALEELNDEVVFLAGAQAITGVKTFSADPIVPAEAYGVGWNASNEPPTKNDVYDKFESLPTLATTTPGQVSIYTLGLQTFVDWIGSSGPIGTFADNGFTLQDNVDPTKQMQFQLSGLAAATTRTLTVPDLNGTLVLTTGSQSLANKTLENPTNIDTARTVVAAEAFGAILNNKTVTLDFASAYRLATFHDAGTTLFNQGAVTGASAESTVHAGRTIKNVAGVALSLGALRIFRDESTVQGDAAAVTIPSGAYQSFRAAPVFGIVAGGTLAITSMANLIAAPTVGPGVTVTTLNAHASAPINTGGAITTLSHYKANNVAPSGGGTITTMYGLSIDVLTGAATLNMGIRNAAAKQEPARAATIGAVGESLIDDTTVLASYYEITNSTGGSLTLTSTPTLPDGVDGQVVTILNVGAQNVVVQDQGTLAGSNLKLGAANRTLGTGDSLRLRYSAALANWYEESFGNVV